MIIYLHTYISGDFMMMRRYLIAKSKHIIVLAIIMVACSVILFSHVIQQVIASDEMKYNSKGFAIGANTTYEELTDIVQHIDSALNEDYIFYQYSYNGFYGLIHNDDMIRLRFIEGRALSEGELQSETPKIMLNETEKSFVVFENGVSYFYYDGIRYEVVGIYEDQENENEEKASGYYNYKSVRKHISPDSYVKGQYLLTTAGNKTSYINNLIKTNDDIYSYSAGFSEAIETTMSAKINRILGIIYNEGGLVQVSAILLLLMFILNTTSVNNWIIMRRNEIRIVNMLGLTHGQITKLLMRDYAAITGASFIFALIMAICINVLVYGTVDVTVYLYASGFAFLLTIIFGLSAFIIIAYKTKETGLIG